MQLCYYVACRLETLNAGIGLSEGLNVMIWGMDLWVFTAFILIYISVVFGIVYGLWPRKEEDKEDT